MMRTFIAIKITPEKKLLDIASTLRKSLEGDVINWADTNKQKLRKWLFRLDLAGRRSHSNLT